MAQLLTEPVARMLRNRRTEGILRTLNSRKEIGGVYGWVFINIGGALWILFLRKIHCASDIAKQLINFIAKSMKESTRLGEAWFGIPGRKPEDGNF
jgi:hypothetical protein